LLKQFVAQMKTWSVIIDTKDVAAFDF